MGKKKPKANGRKPAEKPPGCYVLSLSVESVRCFGKKQTLDCSGGNERPRQWTVILGENGAGKTTLL
jgi:ABC-type molybdenum transport system ATPase subunit/photorepair protein PhrA